MNSPLLLREETQADSEVGSSGERLQPGHMSRSPTRFLCPYWWR